MKVSIVSYAGASFCWNYAIDTFYSNYAGAKVCCKYVVFEVLLQVFEVLLHCSLRHWNTELVSSRSSLTSWGGASLALVGNPSSDGVTTIKMSYIWGRCFSWDWLRKMNAGGSYNYCWCSSFFGFLRPDLSPWGGYRNRCFLVALCCLIVRRLNLVVASKRLLNQQVKILG